jgi:hypothetical protein
MNNQRKEFRLMPQQINCRKTAIHKPRAPYIVGLLLLLLVTAQSVQAQRFVCPPTVDWRVYLASRGAIYLLHSAKKARQQNQATQQAWKASKTSASAAQNPPANTRELWLAGKSAATSEAKIASPETMVAADDVKPVAMAETPRPLTPVELLASARTIFVKSNSVWVKRKSIEDALMKKKEFLALGYAIVKDLSEADLKLEVDHTPLTLRYPFTVTHMQTQVVVASGTVHSLRILNDVPGDTAGSFVKQAKAARTAMATVPRK